MFRKGIEKGSESFNINFFNINQFFQVLIAENSYCTVFEGSEGLIVFFGIQRQSNCL